MPSVRDLILNLQERKEGNALTAAANDLDKLSRGVDATGGAMHDMENDAKRLNAEIERTTVRVKDLHKQFAKTGDESLFGDIRKEEARLRNLRRTLDSLTPEFEQAGANAGRSFFSKAFDFGGEGIKPRNALIGGLVAAIAALAVPIGAIISGAVVGAVGTGGIIGGVLAASHDPRVKSAFGGLAEQAKTEFFEAGKSFIQPTLESTAILSKALASLDLSKTFALAAPDLKIIVQGLADLVANTMPGLNKLLERSGAFAEKAAKGFAYLGTSLSEFLDNVSASPGAIEGLEFGFATLGGIIKALGVSLKWLSDRFQELLEASATTFTVLDDGFSLFGLHFVALHRLAAGFSDAAGANDHASDVVKAWGGAVHYATDAVDDQTAALQRQQDELNSTVDALENAINTMLGLDNAQLAVSKGWKDLSDAVVENGKHWNDNTDAAFKNRDAVLGQIANLERVREGEIKAGESVADANKEFSDGIEKVIAYAGALGATKEQLDRIRGTYEINLVVTGLASAISNALNLFNFGGHRAAGGLVSPGMSYMVGERGPEMFTPATAGTISPNGAAATIVMSFAPTGNRVMDAILRELRDHVRFNGGSADVAFS